MPKNNLIGLRFGRLTVIDLSTPTSCARKRARWLCKCKCGSEIVVRGESLSGNQTRSCGCILKENRRLLGLKHGMKFTRIYSIWQDIKKRCLNPNSKSFPFYGARGITVSDEWKNNFVEFLEDTRDGYADHLTIDRIDTKRGYQKGNTRWITRAEQTLNKRNNVWLSIGGETLVARHWEKRLGKNAGCFHSWVKNHGGTLQGALEHFTAIK